MANFAGTPAPINRFLGFLDADDPTNTPIGLAALARNTMFDLTSARTRDGFQLAMQCLDKSPVTGILGMTYTPEQAGQVFTQVPLAFQYSGLLQYEKLLGSKQMEPIPAGLFTPPANAHMIAVQTYNKGWLAFSNLSVPLSQMACLDPVTLNLDPYGMKPFGWTWLPSTQVLVGEVATPTAPGGNGHTYRCTVAGTTSTAEPTWPTLENGTVTDGGVTWEEYTAVMANRLPPPAQPVLTRDSGGGTFAAGRDVYILLTFLNGMGESLTSVTNKLSDTVLDDAVSIAIPTLASQPGWIRGLVSPYAITFVRVYEADVATGNPAPPEASYQLVNEYALGATAVVTNSASSATYPPTLNTARITPGQLPTPVTEPAIVRVSSGGSFPVGRDVYVLQTYSNAAGETPAGPASVIVDTELDDAVQVTIAPLTGYPQLSQINIYEADVATGSPAPPSTQFAYVGSYAPGDTHNITATASGPPPPTVNATGPGGNIVADNPQGGINGGQGYRYAAIMFENRNYSVSGFTQASVIQYVVDEDGWELSIFNVTPGPGNIIARIVAFTVADSDNAGPFNWIGNLDPQVPSTNFVYPQTFVSDQIAQSATIFYDNVTTKGTFNFTDEYLLADNDVTDRLRIIWPAPCVHIAYCKSVDRMFQTGYYGNFSGCRCSNGGAPEDYYGDTCDIPVGSDDGERAWGVMEFRSIIYLVRERSGMTLSATPTQPNTWTARGRWDKVGACGPRAFDSCDKFAMFVHRSGIYKFEDDPDTMSKEIPYWWQTVNWNAGTTVCCEIDHETHQVQILLPVNGSSVPNAKLMLNYEEGWNNPIHFSTYSGREISMDAARKYSVDDMEAFVCARIERQLPPPPQPVAGDDDIPLTPSSFYVSQFVYGSSGPDGQIQASQPGTFDDNGAGIDWQYETVCPQQAMALSKLEGFVLNARGAGKIPVWLLAMRASAYGQARGKPKVPLAIRVKRDIDLDVEQGEGISRGMRGPLSEKWRMRFTNGKVPGAWCSLKWAAIYVIPMFGGRTESERGG
jgi:hypothetical protein